MAPSGLAILIGAGPATAAGIARILASPSQGNMAVALISRTADPALASSIASSCHGGNGTLRAFKSDTSESSLTRAFDEIKQWAAELDPHLKLATAIYNVKHSHKTPFEDETASRFTESLTVYATGAMVFSQLALKWMLAQYPESSGGGGGGASGPQPMQKRGTLIFTSTLGSLRTNAGYAAYGATRASVRMLAQSLAREYSARGVHVVHAIANGGITDKADGKSGTSAAEMGEEEEGKEQRARAEDERKVKAGEKIRAESVGRLYLSLALQECDLWVHELDMRPAAEKF